MPGRKRGITVGNIKNRKMLYNYFKEKYPDSDDTLETFINSANDRLISSIITNNENWSESTKEGIYFTVAKYLDVNSPNNIKSVRYRQYGYNLYVKRNEDEGNNTLDEREMESYRDHDYFIQILESINPDNLNLTEHYKYLLLSCLTLQPPIRTSFYTSATLLNEKKNNKGEENYIYINRRGKTKVYYIVNQDKATNYKVYAKNKDLSTIQIEDDKLAELIYNSFVKYPRKYLFENNGRPFSDKTILTYLKSITKVPGINIDIMRASYVSYIYSDPGTRHRDKEILANQMRHSVNTASKNYNKVFDKEDLTDQQKDEEIQKLRNKILILESQENKNSSIDNNKDDVKYRKLIRDVLYRANIKNNTLKQDTIDKYKIKFDESTKKYYV